jgi:Probable molybdopterin binding domain
MTTADTPAPKEAVTAALLVIGDRILSGRTKDQNIGYVAEYLTALGIYLAEVRVIGDESIRVFRCRTTLEPSKFLAASSGVRFTRLAIKVDYRLYLARAPHRLRVSPDSSSRARLQQL